MRFILYSIVISLLFVLLQGTSVAAKLDQGVAPELDLKQIKSHIVDLESLEEPDKDSKTALELYRNAQASLKGALEDDLLSAAYKKAVDTSTKELAKLESELKEQQNANDKPHKAKLDLSRDELKQQLDKAEAARSLGQSSLAKLELELRNERLRPDQTSAELQEAKKQLNESGNKLHSIEEGSAEVADARRVAFLAVRHALASRIKRLEMERLSYTPRLGVLRTSVELAEAQLKQSRMRAALFQDRLNKLLAQEAEKAQQAAEKVIQGTLDMPPVVQKEAEYNSQLSQKLGGLTGDIEKLIDRREGIVAKLKQVKVGRERVHQQVEIAGLDESLGGVLLAQNRMLPDVRMLALKAEEYRQQMSQVRLQKFRLSDELQQLSESDGAARFVSQLQPQGLSPSQLTSFTNAMQKLVRNRVQLLNKLEAEYDRYENALSDISLDLRQLSSEVVSFQDFLTKSLVWVPSAPPLGLADLGEIGEAVAWFLSWDNWSAVALKLEQSVQLFPIRVGLVVLLAVVLTLVRGRMLGQMEAAVPKIGRVNHDRFRYSVVALIYTFLLALPPPLIMGGAGWLLYKYESTSFVWSVGMSAMVASLFYLILRFGRFLVMPNGLARNHLHWDRHAVDVYARALPWVTPMFVVVAFVVGITGWELEEGYWSSLGRIASLVSTLAIMWFVHISLNPNHGALSRSKHIIVQGLRLKVLWYPLALLLVFGLLILSVQGYHYSAIFLKRLLISSFIIGVLILLLHSFARRWLMVAERRLALKQARARRLAAQETKAAKEAADAAGEGMHEVEDLEEINLATINEQTQRLLRVLGTASFFIALFFLWSTLTPALGGLDEVILWHYQAVGGELSSVSLWDLLLAVAVVMLMLVAVRNLPGLLEITVLQPLSLEPGNRYAVSMISRYSIVAAGFFIVLNMLGISWGDVQWLVAAMGVGLGFGLKEIFANFFSGLIILFERPIRIGDTVTIDTLSGTVTKIRIRATTVTDFDNKEQVIPNQNFLINPLINWTLSDPITRVVFTVGIAYGSDTEKALQVITDVVRAHSEVLEEPRPTVFFVGFGASSLDFEVRVFVRERLRRMPLRHDLHMAMNKALAEAGIEIPFPQRDLHLRSIAPGVDLNGSGSD